MDLKRELIVDKHVLRKRKKRKKIKSMKSLNKISKKNINSKIPPLEIINKKEMMISNSLSNS